MMTRQTYRSSPIGLLTLVADDRGRLSRIEFGEASRNGDGVTRERDDTSPEGVLAEAVLQLDEYFAGIRRDFELDLAPKGTPFQLAVWDALLAIPYGATASYGD